VSKKVKNLIEKTAYATIFRNEAFKGFSPEELLKMGKLLSEYILKEKDGKIITDAYTVDDTAERVELINLIQKIDFRNLLKSALIMSIAADEAATILSNADFSQLKSQPEILFEKETALGRIVVGNIGNNVYSKDCTILIDLGGDDLYLNNAGGTPGDVLMAIAIDVSGNDTYQGQDYCQGCGFGGVGILMDLKGNDTYIARNFSQASALGGFGMLYDASGDDTYTADFGAQSSAIFGYSILSDRAGNDSYKCSMLGQAGASTMGVAILVEGGGNDTYQGGGKYPFYGTNDSSAVQGAAIGMRPWPAQGRFTLYGGIALLSDASGDDRYSSQAFAQGGSYILSLGMLVDSAGNDVYSGTDYVQGSGCHLGAAVMVDRMGNDSYSSTNHSTGGSLDRSAGVFMDIKGNDTYNSPEGVGYSGKPRGCGIFVDCAGDDLYEKGVLGRARYPYSENTQSNAFFLDMNGSDTYSQTYCANNKFWQQGQWGMARDWESKPITSSNPIWAPMSPPVLDYEMMAVEGYDKLIEQAQSLSTFERFSAFDDIINANDKAVDVVRSLVGAWNPYTLKDMIDVIEAMRLRGLIKLPDYYIISERLPYIKEDVRLAGVTYFFRMFNSQTKINMEIIDALMDRALNDESSEVRSIAVMALGKTGDVYLIPTIEKVLSDKDWSVRRRAVMALSYIKNKKSLDILINLFKTEKAYQVRPQIVSVMGRLGFDEALPYLKNVATENEFVRYYAARALALNFKDKTGIDDLIGLLDLENLAITDEIVGILKELTKQDFAKDKAKWQKWWNENKDGLKL